MQRSWDRSSGLQKYQRKLKWLDLSIKSMLSKIAKNKYYASMNIYDPVNSIFTFCTFGYIL